MKRPIFVPRVEGTASRQAHADLPAGTYEREISKEGFFGPAAFFHHKHPPTAWTSFEGPLRPHAFDLNKLARRAELAVAGARTCCATRNVRVRFWQAATSMDHLVRNADGDDLLFVHQGAGDFIATTVIWRSRPATTSSSRAARCGASRRSSRSPRC